MGRDEYDDRPPRRRSRRDEDQRDAPRKPRSGLVTSVAVLNFVVGPVVLAFGMCGWLTIIPGISTMQSRLLGLPGGVGDTIVAQVLLIVAIFACGAGAFVTAVGLLYRAAWARILALLLGGGAAPVGLLYLVVTFLFEFGPADAERTSNVVFSAIRTGFFLGYCLWTYLVLLHPRRVAEFY